MASSDCVDCPTKVNSNMEDRCSACVICGFMTFCYKNLEQHFRVSHDGVPSKSIFKLVSQPLATLLRKRDVLMYNSIPKHFLNENPLHVGIEKFSNTPRLSSSDFIPDLEPNSDEHSKPSNPALHFKLDQSLNDEDPKSSEPAPDLKLDLIYEDSESCPLKSCKLLPAYKSLSVIPHVKPDANKMRDEIPEIISVPSTIESILSGHDDLEVDIAGKPLLSLDTLLSAETRTDEGNKVITDGRDEHMESESNSGELNLTSKVSDCPETSGSAWICWMCFGKFARCMGTERTLFLDYSNSFCPFAKINDLEDAAVGQKQIRLLCPKDCSFVSADVRAYTEHVPMCLKSEAHTKRDDFMRNQKCMMPLPSTSTEDNNRTPDVTTNLKTPRDLTFTQESRNVPAHKMPVQHETREFMRDRSENASASSIQTDKAFGLQENALNPNKDVVKHKWYKCKLCKKIFSNLFHLHKHMKEKHIGERPYSCKECGKCFGSLFSVKGHVKLVHTLKERTYKCQDCDKRFKTRNHLRAHITSLHEDKKQYRCNKCGNRFKFFGILKRHMTIHTKKRPYKCEKCGKCFKRVDTLQVHVKLVHTDVERPYRCEDCGKRFTFSSSLTKHKRVHSVEKPYKCKECGKCVKHPMSLQIHTKLVHTEERPYKCKFKDCGKGFKSIAPLKAHKIVHTEERPYKCKDCGVGFKSLKSSKRHMKEIHAEGRPYKCTQCGKCFKRSDILQNHMKVVHTEERAYKCEDCKLCFKSLGVLKSHMVVHTEAKPYNCEECGKCFKTSNCLRLHMIVHKEEKPWKCTECGWCFKRPQTLQKHMVVHTEERPYKCTECGKCFKNSKTLQGHKIVHTEERPYKCMECGKRFKSSYTLHLHMAVHTEERPHKCTECGKCFKNSQTLHGHRFMHTKERPYKCKECAKCFKSPAVLRQHMKVHTEERPYSCKKCGKCFKSPYALKSHLKVHTDEN